MSMPGEEAERFGHTIRQFQVAVSTTALALAWARQENAPHGSTVIVEREVSPLGRHARKWEPPAESTLAMAVVLRPPLPVDEADAAWLVAGLAAAEGAEVASGRPLATWWPDGVVDRDSKELLAASKAEVQLGPGRVKSAVVTMRLDLPGLGLDPDQRDELVEAVLASIDKASEGLEEGAAGVAAAYQARCALIGERVKIRLMPQGETRGVVRGVDRMARLELESGTGMAQRVSVDMLRDFEVA